MGWTFFHRARGEKIADTLAREFNGPSSGEVLACRVVNIKTAYLAYRQPNGNVFAIVCLLQFRPHDRLNFGYKDMDETMGPYAYDCPPDILDMLSPTDNKTANEWRDACRARLSSRAIKIEQGDVVRYNQPITLSNGRQYRDFEVACLRPWYVREPLDTWGVRFRVSRDWLQKAIERGDAVKYSAADFAALVAYEKEELRAALVERENWTDDYESDRDHESYDD